MKIRIGTWLIGAMASVGMAATAVAAGDPEAGYYKAKTCMGCHASPSRTNVYPTYNVPKIAGQHPEYIISALKAYAAGQRDHPTMLANAVSLSDEDMADIAAPTSQLSNSDSRFSTCAGSS